MKLEHEVLTLAGALLLALAGCGKAEPTRPAPATSAAPREVRVARAELRPMERTLQVVGTLNPHEEATVAAQVAGQIEQSYVDVGSPTRAGEKMALIDTASYQALVRQAAANLARATARGENVRQTLARVQQLQKDRVASASELDQALADAAAARAEVQAAEAAAAIARLNLDRSQVKAPFDGSVAERLASVGDYVAIGAPIVKVVKTDPLRLRLQVPERESPAVRVGQSVRITVEGIDDAHIGRIARIAPAIREADRMLEVEADVPNRGGLRGGLFVRAEIVVDDQGQGLSVPSAALVTFAGLEKVVVVKDGKALEKPVTTGRRGEGSIEILTGLKADDTVALDTAGLRTGQPVRAKAAGASPLYLGEAAERCKDSLRFCIRRPVFAVMIVLTLVVVGTVGYASLGVDRFPSVDVPIVRVNARLAGASPAEMESQISQPIEEAVDTIEGINELRSVNGSGNAFVVATFNLDRDIDVAAQDVRDRISTVIRDLPEDTLPPTISKSDTDQQPVLSIALSGDRARRELTEIADKTIKTQLERSPGVGQIEIVGGMQRSINVWVDADRLAAYQIPITAVRDAVARQNANIPGGNVTTDRREQTLRTMGRLTDARDFNDMVVATRNGGSAIRVRDIGWAEDGTKEERSLARLNGRPNVTLEVLRQSGSNTVAVIDGVKERLKAIQANLPADLKLEIIRDQSRYIHQALHEIKMHLVLGSILACLVVLLFMRNWRATIIAAVAIPASVIASFGMMKALGFTLNSVTMLALVLMVGIVIDDAIVVLENIFRYIEEKKMGPFEAARAATAEIGLAVMATTLSLVVIFVPVSFMSSISGRFLYQFGITSAVAVMVSLLVSFTLTPMMSARLLRTKAKEADESEGPEEAAAPRSRAGFYARIDSAYTRILAGSMRRRWLVAGLALGVMAASVPLYGRVQQEYLPSNVDEGEFDVRVTAPEGTGPGAIDQVAAQVEEALRDLPMVSFVLTTIGSSMIGGLNSANFYVRLAPHEERTFNWARLVQLRPWRAFQGNYSQRDIQQLVRQRLRQLPGVRVAIRNPQTFIGGGANFDIDFALLGPDLDVLHDYADRLRKRAPELGLQDADITLKLDRPEIRAEIDRERAADLGVDTADIANALRIMVGGDERVTRFRDEAMNEDYDVQVRVKDGGRNDAATIARLYVPRRTGGLARLDNVVKLVPTQTASRIDRLDRQRQVSLRAAVAPGYAQADRIAALRAEVEAMGLPTGYSTRVAGRARELETTFNEFLWAFLLSVVLMYIVLASQFESVVHPFTILLSLPLAVPFAFLSLLLASQTLNLYSALGLLVLFGVVKKNAILQVDHTIKLRAAGKDRLEAILEGSRDRLRPILMTTLTLIAGMLPLALGTGPGAEERRAVAVVVIGGQSLCLLLTLIVTPVAYSLLDDLAEAVRGRRRVAAAPGAVETVEG